MNLIQTGSISNRNQRFGIQLRNDGTLCIHGAWNDFNPGASTSGITDGEWHAIKVTYASSREVKIYIDGTLKATGAMPVALNTQGNDNWIGKSSEAGWNEFYGEMKEIAFHDSVV